MQVRPDEPLAGMLTKGTVLWRAVQFEGPSFDTILPSLEFQTTNKPGQHIARLKLEPDWIWEPTIVSSTMLGIITFIEDEIPPNWTHMLISGISVSMREAPRKRSGAVFANVPPPCMGLQEYATWRKDLAQRILLQDDERFSECLALSKRFPGGTDGKRLVFHRSPVPGVEFEYRHFEDLELQPKVS